MEKEKEYKLLDEFMRQTYNPDLTFIAEKTDGLLNKDGKVIDATEYKFTVINKD